MALPTKPLTREEAIRMAVAGVQDMPQVTPMSIKEAILAGDIGSVDSTFFDKALTNKDRVELEVSSKASEGETT